MNAAAQAELTALENLLSTLATDVSDAVSDLQAADLTDAQNEWTAILSESQLLSLTAYIWPSPTMLSAPSMFAAIGNDICAIATSGEMYHYTGSTSSWADMGVTALSCAGEGSVLVAIDGAPLNGTAIGGGGGASTYFVKSYASGAWTTISTFPAAAVAAATIYAVNQTVTDRQVYQYSGSGTTWTALTQLPGPDAAIQIAVAGGVLFALANNSQFVYQYDSTTAAWAQVGSTTFAVIQANGNNLALVDTGNNQYLYNTIAGGAPINTGYAVVQVAQLTSGDHYGVNTSEDLWLADPNTSPITYTCLVGNGTATGVFASDTDQVYYTDNVGNIWNVSTTGSATQLPAIPS